VRHVTTGNRFTFRVSDRRKKPRFLRREYSSGHPSKPAVRAKIEEAAHAFAEHEARKAGLID
jgi:hypothetical protein